MSGEEANDVGDPPYGHHLHSLGEIARSPLLGLRMLDALAMAARVWPGQFIVTDVMDDSDEVWVRVQFWLNDKSWNKTVRSCCPEAHVEQALREATSHFLGIPFEHHR